MADRGEKGRFGGIRRFGAFPGKYGFRAGFFSGVPHDTHAPLGPQQNAYGEKRQKDAKHSQEYRDASIRHHWRKSVMGNSVAD